MNNAQVAFDYFVNQGLSPAQAAGIVGNLQGESGQGLNTGSINPGDGRDGSDSIGVAQWNGSRAQALKAYADSKGMPWTDLNTQLEFLHSELQGPEGSAYRGLQAAQTPEDAARAMLAYERPKDWNKPGSHQERAQYAAKAFASYGGGSPAAAPVSPAAAPGAPLNVATQAPLNVASQQPPILPAAQIPSAGMGQAGLLGGGSPPFAQTPDQVQTQPIFYAQRRSPDLTRLRASLAQAPIFSRG